MVLLLEYNIFVLFPPLQNIHDNWMLYAQLAGFVYWVFLCEQTGGKTDIWFLMRAISTHFVKQWVAFYTDRQKIFFLNKKVVCNLYGSNFCIHC